MADVGPHVLAAIMARVAHHHAEAHRHAERASTAHRPDGQVSSPPPAPADQEPGRGQS